MNWALASTIGNQVNALVHVLRRIGRTGLLAFLLAAGTSACPSNQTADGFETVWDPIEGFNRTIFQINQGIDFILIRPVSATYRQVVPDPLQEIVTNVLRHLRTPVILINELLQGDWEGAEVAATRFFLNTIVGVAGIADVAAYVDPDLAFQAEDFGQTLAVWGVGDGPYLVLPILGPSNLRDTGGLVVDIATEYVLFPDSDPLTVGRIVLTGVDARSRSMDALDEIERSSIDFYAAIRSLYAQNRRSQIYDGSPPPTGSFPDFEDFEDFEDEPGDAQDQPPRAEAPPQSDILVSEARPPVQSGAPDALILDLEPLRKSAP